MKFNDHKQYYFVFQYMMPRLLTSMYVLYNNMALSLIAGQFFDFPVLNY